MANNVKLPESIPFRNQTWQFKLLHKMMVLFFSSIKGVFSIATFSLDPWCSTSGCPSPSSLELVGTPTSLGASLLHGVSCIQNGHFDGETDDKPVDLRGSRCSINPSCISWCQAKAGNVQNPIINHPRWLTKYPRIQIDGFYLINQLNVCIWLVWGGPLPPPKNNLGILYNSHFFLPSLNIFLVNQLKKGFQFTFNWFQFTFNWFQFTFN